MAAPAAVARGTPDGFLPQNGFGSFITFPTIPQLNIWEKDTGVPGQDGGEAVETTTHHNVTYRTFAPRSLVTLTPFQVVAAYDPCVYDDLLTLININDNITITFFDSSTLAFWGFLQSVEFAPLVDGEQPELTLTIVPTNWDPDNCVEAGPVLTCNGTC